MIPFPYVHLCSFRSLSISSSVVEAILPYQLVINVKWFYFWYRKGGGQWRNKTDCVWQKIRLFFVFLQFSGQMLKNWLWPIDRFRKLWMTEVSIVPGEVVLLWARIELCYPPDKRRLPAVSLLQSNPPQKQTNFHRQHFFTRQTSSSAAVDTTVNHF